MGENRVRGGSSHRSLLRTSRQGWSRAGALSAVGPPWKGDRPLTNRLCKEPPHSTVFRTPSLGQCRPHLPSSCPRDFPIGPELPIRTISNTVLHPPASIPRCCPFRGLCIPEEGTLGGHSFPHPQFLTKPSSVGGRTPVSMHSFTHATNTLPCVGLSAGDSELVRAQSCPPSAHIPRGDMGP